MGREINSLACWLSSERKFEILMLNLFIYYYYFFLPFVVAPWEEVAQAQSLVGLTQGLALNME